MSQQVVIALPSGLGEILGKRCAQRGCVMEDVILELVQAGLEAERMGRPAHTRTKVKKVWP